MQRVGRYTGTDIDTVNFGAALPDVVAMKRSGHLCGVHPRLRWEKTFPCCSLSALRALLAQPCR